MKKIITIFLITIFVFSFGFNEVYAKNNIKAIADVDSTFSIKYQDLPDIIQFKTTQTKTIPDVLSIPEGSVVTLKVIKAQRELRWHKSGFILCKLVSYTPEITNIPVDVSDKEIYLTIRKYEEIDKKEATFIGIELVLAQGASFFAPGVDIGYYFIKGAIQRKKHPHWFKAGVHNAYENSICWFWLKGKPIELEPGEQVKIKDVKPEKVEKLIAKMEKRADKQNIKAAKRLAKKDKKALKRELKYEKKLVNCTVVEEGIESIIIDRSSIAGN